MLTITPHTDLRANVHSPKISEIADFLGREEPALVELLEAFGDLEAAEAARQAARLSEARVPELQSLGNAIKRVLAGLDDIQPSFVEHMMIAGVCQRDAPAAIRWTGARLTDLLGIIEAA
ncbi:hypothetical protein SAMN05421762_0941 [Pseudooceanicola nitratireducens]|jgi:hypothetical protein|uniref:Uncharacterized protein n=1 Tax=Pseudooceanicola nitratireducens TaxID=517719 RepID=A0A1I1J921_9RHOB|nr:hypothetical protein [Pseudooceanicola nitratireducens]SEJ30144.1 hypothetical protein SAMN05216183_102937 [Pseudooceanicola nitratireducens]SFC44885.1 hypothetical protein SAMN05421762_0941 [Pseudooceanicola nitratireducens]